RQDLLGPPPRASRLARAPRGTSRSSRGLALRGVGSGADRRACRNAAIHDARRRILAARWTRRSRPRRRRSLLLPSRSTNQDLRWSGLLALGRSTSSAFPARGGDLLRGRRAPVAGSVPRG